MRTTMNDDFFDCFGATFISGNNIIMGEKHALGYYAAQVLRDVV